MAVLGRLLVSSAERLDLPDFLAIDSFSQGDWKYFMSSLVGGTKPYVLKGFDVINPNAAIGTQSVSIRVADSVVYYPGSTAGPFFHGLSEGNTASTPLIPELRKNSTNYVYLTLSTFDAAKDTRAFWDPDKEGGVGGEFTQDINTETALSAVVNVSVSSFPANTIPICKVVVGSNFVTSIEDARDMMFRLASGGISPNPLSRYQFRNLPNSSFARSEPNTLMSSALDPNAFQGGDKNIQTLKEWMDVVMTKLLELGGTSYWYEGAVSLNLVNMFKDALATSIKSKGVWDSSTSTPGLLTWTEDMTLQSVFDKKDVILRAGSKTILNDQVLFFYQNRDINFNTGSVSVEWFNGLNYVNGSLGSFENLTKGDWVKKSNDNDQAYLRVEEFYGSTNLGGGVTSPASALSIKLSDIYSGSSGFSQGIYTQGEYLSTDTQVVDRDDSILSSNSGNLYWLAMRSDRVMNVSNITTTQLTVDIIDHDGLKAKCTSTAHGLSDKQRITISGTTNFNGTYAVEVEDANTFYIPVVGGPFADELSESAFYATITTSLRSTANGLQLESANHGFKTDQLVRLSSTTNYNGPYNVFAINNTSFSIPVSSLIATELSGLATSVEIHVRDNSGPIKLDQGEIIHIGESSNDNLRSFIGMDNETQLHPIYNVESNYNAIDGYVNFNSDATDNLTRRVSKLTSMMADKAQDKTISFNLSNTQSILNTTNGLSQDITVVPKIGQVAALQFMQPSTLYSVSVTLTGTLSLLANQVAYVTLNRNANTTIASLAALSISNTDELPVGENIFIFAIRGSGTSILLWDKTPVRLYSTVIENLVTEVTTITLSPASSVTTGQYFTINSALDQSQYYVWFNKDGAGGDPLVIGKIGIAVNISTGDTTITIAGFVNTALNLISDFSSVDNLGGTITVTNSAAGSTTDAANFNVGGIFSILVNTQGSGSALNYVVDGDVLETAIKKLDKKIADVAALLLGKAYAEPLLLVSGAPSNSNEITGPITSSTNISIPPDSRNSYLVKSYVVGDGRLEVFLNGQYLELNNDWAEVGLIGSNSTVIQTLQNLVVTDQISFRIDKAS